MASDVSAAIWNLNLSRFINLVICWQINHWKINCKPTKYVLSLPSNNLLVYCLQFHSVAFVWADFLKLSRRLRQLRLGNDLFENEILHAASHVYSRHIVPANIYSCQHLGYLSSFYKRKNEKWSNISIDTTRMTNENENEHEQTRKWNEKWTCKWTDTTLKLTCNYLLWLELQRLPMYSCGDNRVRLLLFCLSHTLS